MNDPASREDLEAARDRITAKLDEMAKSVENMRSQNSAEHGAIHGVMRSVLEAMHWLKAKWIAFTKP